MAIRNSKGRNSKGRSSKGRSMKKRAGSGAGKKRARSRKPAAEIVRQETIIEEPVTTQVQTPATLAEALGDPLVEVPDEKKKTTEVVRTVVRKRKTA